MISRTSSTPVLEAASISSTSTSRSSAIATQWTQTPHGSIVGPPAPSGPTQLSARAISRAVVVLPMPRTPVRMKAWWTRFSRMALVSVRTRTSWPISSSKVAGRYLRARTRYSGASCGGAVSAGSGLSAIELRRRRHAAAPRRPGCPSSGREGKRWKTGQRPGRNSLRLLPSGPDRVGEAPVRAGLPNRVYQVSGATAQAETAPARRAAARRATRARPVMPTRHARYAPERTEFHSNPAGAGHITGDSRFRRAPRPGNRAAANAVKRCWTDPPESAGDPEGRS